MGWLALRIAFGAERSPRETVAAIILLLTAGLFLMSPNYAWYFLALVPLIPLGAGAPAWALTLGAFLLYRPVFLPHNELALEDARHHPVPRRAARSSGVSAVAATETPHGRLTSIAWTTSRSIRAATSRPRRCASDGAAVRPPVCLYLEVTNRCNLLCTTCPRTYVELEPPADMSLGPVPPHRRPGA